MSKKLTYIDLFAGCGGLSLGLHNSGWEGLFAIEKDPMAFETLKYNLIDKRKHFRWPKWIPQKEHDLLDVLKKYTSYLTSLEEVDLVAGGPPCQGFSMAGRRKESDKRNSLFKAYINFIELVKPKTLLLENVKGFTIGFKNGNKRGRAFSDVTIEKLEKLGYDVYGKIIDFSDLSIPQRRKRFILIGFRKDLNLDPKLFFKKLSQNNKEFCKKKNIKQKNSVKDAISDLVSQSKENKNSSESQYFKEGDYSKSKSNYQRFLRGSKKVPDSHRFSNHNPKTVKKFRYILESCKKNSSIDEKTKNRFNLKKRSIIPLCENSPSPTLTTLPDDYIHYSEPRILTVREYARIQSFDDHFEIKGKYTTGGKLRSKENPRYTQVGNAIPPLGGEQFGYALKEMLS